MTDRHPKKGDRFFRIITGGGNWEELRPAIPPPTTHPGQRQGKSHRQIRPAIPPPTTHLQK